MRAPWCQSSGGLSGPDAPGVNRSCGPGGRGTRPICPWPAQGQNKNQLHLHLIHVNINIINKECSWCTDWFSVEWLNCGLAFAYNGLHTYYKRQNILKIEKLSWGVLSCSNRGLNMLGVVLESMILTGGALRCSNISLNLLGVTLLSLTPWPRPLMSSWFRVRSSITWISPVKIK